LGRGTVKLRGTAAWKAAKEKGAAPVRTGKKKREGAEGTKLAPYNDGKEF